MKILIESEPYNGSYGWIARIIERKWLIAVVVCRGFANTREEAIARAKQRYIAIEKGTRQVEVWNPDEVSGWELD